MNLRIHKEGRIIIPISFLILFLIYALFAYLLRGTSMSFLLYPLGAAAVIFFGLVINFFRNPERNIQPNPNHILSPCDGEVVVIEEIEEPIYFQEKVIQISVFMSPFNVHVNRNPISGKIVFLKYFPGKYLMAFNPKSSELNEQSFIVAKNNRFSVGYKQIAGFLARRLIWYVKEQDQVEQGEEFGFIRFGSRLDILIPVSANVQVKLNEKVVGGETILATFSS